MKFDPFSYRYPSRRNLVYGSRGMVATSHPLAAAAGLEILKTGGNAIDAAIATAAALTVVEPTSNGIGSDAFAIVWKDGKLHGLNGSGPAPGAFDLDAFRAAGFEKAPPKYGWMASTVPGAPATWAELSRLMGRLSLEACLAPAISYATEGYAVSVTVSHFWKLVFARLSRLAGDVYAPWRETFCPGGRTPAPGELFRSPGHAYTLSQIAATGGKSFYTGEIADRIIDFSNRTGGFFSREDLRSFSPRWVEPLRVNYRGLDVWELPPNGQGVVVLMALRILEGFEFSSHECPEDVHRQIEAIKLAFADALRYVADPSCFDAPLSKLLCPSYAEGRRALIEDRARRFDAGDPYAGGTVYLCTADRDGNMVSYIQSNFRGFGSAVVIPDTGIALNNRACCFSMDPKHPNALMPGKRPYNTIIPGFLSKGGEAIGPFGVMGAYMQPQGHVQAVLNMVDFHMNPQEALDAPRWQWMGDLSVAVEPGFSFSVAQKLERMGHEVSSELYPFEFGRGEMIVRTEDGTFAGAAEPRADGCVAAW